MRVPFDELHDTLRRALLATGMEADRADLSARLFAEASRDGVASHGLNRFPRFMRMIARGVVDVRARPARLAAHGALERWDGHGGPGNLNACEAMARAIALGREHGIGCVALANTNHWMRGGSYGWQAADAGVIGICWTNTLANLPPWGAADPRVGNNPLVIAVPREAGHVVLDMAMSQFSVGDAGVVPSARRAAARRGRLRRGRARSRAIPPPSRRRGGCCRRASGKDPACRSSSTWSRRSCRAAARRTKSRWSPSSRPACRRSS